MTQEIAGGNFPDLLKPGFRVYLAGCGGQSAAFIRALEAQPKAAAGVSFCGVYIPGINTYDYSALNPTARMEVIFLQPSFREGYEAGRIDYLPLPYVNTYRYYETGPQFDIATVQVSPPDADGDCSLGIAADFSPAALANCKTVVAHINPNMPVTSAPKLPLKSFDYWFEEDTPLLAVPDSGESKTLNTIAEIIAEAIPNGASLQFGLGKLQNCLVRALTGHKNLKIHSGMIADPVIALAASGALATATGTITTGVALGEQALYEWCANNPLIQFAPVGYTHQTRTLQAVPAMHCINSAMEVDLLGQANGETINGKQVSGCGGLVDFGRGARLSDGGRFILATPATAAGGTVSRIVPMLDGRTPVSIARQDIDCVVTEYGLADLRHKSVQQRAEALIAIAAPQFRESLAREWRDSMVKWL